MAFLIDCKSQDCGFWNRTELTNAYFDDIKGYPILTSDEERKLLKKAKSKNPVISSEARKKLVECNQRFIVSVARRWQKGDNLMDIVNEANIGLLMAIDNYDLSKKQRFLTYAVWWVRKYINEYVIFNEKALVPSNAVKLYTYVPKARNRFFVENDRYPTAHELKDFLKKEYNISVKHASDLETVTMSSIDDSYFEPKEHSLSEDTLAYESITSTNNVEEDNVKSDNKNMVETLLKLLGERDSEIVREYYGIGCDEKHIESIARSRNITTERVRQIIKSSLKKMKNNTKFMIR